MKKAILLLAFIPLFGFTQSIENLDYVSPFHDDVAAIQKNGEWAFINQKGDIVMNYRSDLVTTTSDGKTYPIFVNNRCLITKEEAGVTYFGYIDKTGATVIKPQFLNATNFKNNVAIALNVVKENSGKNNILGKSVVSYRYYEVTIDTNGEVKDYLSPDDGISVVLEKKYLSKPPKISSKHLGDQLVVTKGENGKWTVKKVN